VARLLTALLFVASPRADQVESVRRMVSDLVDAVNAGDAETAAGLIFFPGGTRLTGFPDRQRPEPGSREKFGTFSSGTDGIFEKTRLAEMIRARSESLKGALHRCSPARVRFVDEGVAVADWGCDLHDAGGRRLAQSTVLGALLFSEGRWRWRFIAPVLPLLPTAVERSEPLDGTRWILSEGDQIIFEKGYLFAASALKRGYYPAAYFSRREGAETVWIAELGLDATGVMVWTGRASAEKMEGTFAVLSLPDRLPAERTTVWTARREG
jgi:hypothetical protein